MDVGKTVSQVTKNDRRIGFAENLSFFYPHLQHYVDETIAIGGEAYISRSREGEIRGLFIYDASERSGTIFTRSREVFDYFYDMKQFDNIFAEMKTEHKCEAYDIHSIDLESAWIEHRFRNEISVVEWQHRNEIRQFMALTHPGTNKNWVTVALDHGDECFTVRLQDEIAGLGWASSINRVGRLYSLFVKPQFRRLGIGQDIVLARLLWLKSKGARSAFSEISRENLASSRIAMKAQMKVAGQIFQYIRTGPAKTVEPIFAVS